MRKIIFIGFLAFALFACNNKTKTNPEPKGDTSTVVSTLPPDKPLPVIINKAIKKEDYDAGLVLVSNADCKTCHKPQEKLIGPSYQDIADKYPINKATIDTLTEKVVKGGSGNWGQIPMQAHANLSKDDAKLMVKYVLAFKNN